MLWQDGGRKSYNEANIRTMLKSKPSAVTKADLEAVADKHEEQVRRIKSLSSQ